MKFFSRVKKVTYPPTVKNIFVKSPDSSPNVWKDIAGGESGKKGDLKI